MNGRDGWEYIALHWAAWNGLHANVRELLMSGADPSVTTRDLHVDRRDDERKMTPVDLVAWQIRDIGHRMETETLNNYRECMFTFVRFRRAVTVIQTRFRQCMSDPAFLMCRNRLLREFSMLVQNVKM